jgi:hypothetical protein
MKMRFLLFLLMPLAATAQPLYYRINGVQISPDQMETLYQRDRRDFDDAGRRVDGSNTISLCGAKLLQVVDATTVLIRQGPRTIAMRCPDTTAAIEGQIMDGVVRVVGRYNYQTIVGPSQILLVTPATISRQLFVALATSGRIDIDVDDFATTHRPPAARKFSSGGSSWR